MDQLGKHNWDRVGGTPKASSTGSPTPLCTQVPSYTQWYFWLRTVRETLETMLDPPSWGRTSGPEGPKGELELIPQRNDP